MRRERVDEKERGLGREKWSGEGRGSEEVHGRGEGSWWQERVFAGAKDSEGDFWHTLALYYRIIIPVNIPT